MQIDKIDDIPLADTVYDVSQGTPQNKRKSQPEKPADLTLSEKRHHYQSTNNEPYHDKKPPLPAA